MKKILLTTVASLCLLVHFAQNKTVYDANAEVRSVSGFNAIRVSHGIELLLTHGDKEAVAVSAKEIKDRDAIKTEVVNGELRIYIAQKAAKWWKQLISKGEKPKAYVSYTKLEKIDGSSGSKTTLEGTLNAGSLDMDISSGATIKGDVKAMHLTLDASSGGSAYLGGSAENLTVDASSGAHVFGYDLSVARCKADASSGGKIQIQVNQELNVYASSGGGINYKGKGAIMDISTSSGGKVRKE
jgi:hypothetical protein